MGHTVNVLMDSINSLNHVFVMESSSKTSVIDALKNLTVHGMDIFVHAKLAFLKSMEDVSKKIIKITIQIMVATFVQ